MQTNEPSEPESPPPAPEPKHSLLGWLDDGLTLLELIALIVLLFALGYVLFLP